MLPVLDRHTAHMLLKVCNYLYGKHGMQNTHTPPCIWQVLCMHVEHKGVYVFQDVSKTSMKESYTGTIYLLYYTSRALLQYLASRSNRTCSSTVYLITVDMQLLCLWPQSALQQMRLDEGIWRFFFEDFFALMLPPLVLREEVLKMEMIP